MCPTARTFDTTFSLGTQEGIKLGHKQTPGTNKIIKNLKLKNENAIPIWMRLKVWQTMYDGRTTKLLDKWKRSILANLVHCDAFIFLNDLKKRRRFLRICTRICFFVFFIEIRMTFGAVWYDARNKQGPISKIACVKTSFKGRAKRAKLVKSGVGKNNRCRYFKDWASAKL